jgi:hypothetical protein
MLATLTLATGDSDRCEFVSVLANPHCCAKSKCSAIATPINCQAVLGRTHCSLN